MEPITDSRDSRSAPFRECRGFPAIPAPPIRERETAGGKILKWLLRLLVAVAFLGVFF